MEALSAHEHEIGTVTELIDSMALVRSDSAFLISPEAGRVLSFSGLREQSKAISARLRQARLEPGDKVAFLMDNGLFTVQLFLGTMYGGLVSVPLNVRAGVSQLVFTLDHSDAKIVFVEEQYRSLLEEVLAGISRKVQVINADADTFATECAETIGDAPTWSPAPDDDALLMYTSGSVGQPKGAMHTHRSLLAHGHNSMQSHQLTDADRSLLVLPLYHINAECVTLMPTLLSGGSVVVPHHFNVSDFWDWLGDHQCTWSAVVPTIIAQLLNWQDPRANQRKENFARIRFLRSSSAPLSPSLQIEFLKKFELLLIQAMGSSEGGNVFSNPLPPAENKIGCAGLAWGFDTRIIDREGRDVPTGELGEILIRGAALMRGYYKNPEETAAAIDADGWMHTGDLAYRDKDGYFFVVGRSKELIIKGGMNIAPRQIDEVLESHPSVLEAAVVGVPDHYLGEDLVAFVVLRTGMAADERQMLAFCESRLGHFKTPTRIHFVADLPKGPSGKVQRLRLLDDSGRPVMSALASSNSHSARPVSQPEPTSMEATISQAWADVLRQGGIDRDANFFSLGGDSVMAIQCLSRLRAKLPVALSLSDFFENATVSRQAALVAERMSAVHRNGNGASAKLSLHTWKQVKPEQPDGSASSQTIPARGKNLPYPLSSGQQRIWFFGELAPEVPLYNECEAVRLTGKLDAEGLEAALNLIIARYEILRTTIQVAADRPIAIVHQSWPIRIKRIDLTDLNSARRKSEIERLMIEEPRRPYRLESEPGIRATLVRLGAEDHVFILMMHHLVCDWASEGILWRELSSAYRAISRREPVALARLPVQYGDYAVWQQQRVDEADFKEDLIFWQNNLRGAPEMLDLPSDRTRPSVQSYRGARQRFRFDATLTEALRNRSRGEKTSLFALFAAALKTLLYRYTGTEDIVLGIPVADRERPELESVIGFLLHTQALRTRLSGSMTFRDLLASVRKGSVDLYTHREVPFEQVVSMMRPDRSLSHSPLFQVMINWRDQGQHLSSIGMDGLEVESLLAETRTSKFDLTLLVTDGGDEILLEAEYSTDLFDHERIARMFGHYETMLKAVATDPEQRLAELPLLTDAERDQLVVQFNQTGRDYPRECVHQLFEIQAERTPEAVAIVARDGQLTYRELNRRANRVARKLLEAGVTPQTVVAICIDRSAMMLVGLLGILKAGAAYLPLDPGFPQQRLAFMLEDSAAPFLVTTSDLASRFTVGSARLICADEAYRAGKDHESSNPQVGVTAKADAYVIYTSGSTGKPKGVVVTHGSLTNLLHSMREEIAFTSRDVLLAVTTLSFDIAGLELYLPLISGARVVLLDSNAAADGSRVIEMINTMRPTVMQATPSLWRILIASGWRGESRMRIISGGEPLPRSLADELLDRVGTVFNAYGPTETTIWSTIHRVKRGTSPVPIGHPLANTQLYVLDSSRQPVPLGVVGELYIGGDGVARGYLGRPELTAERFLNDPCVPNSRMYRTGDKVRRLPDGDIEFINRVDNQLKVRGIRVEPGEIEAALMRHPQIQAAAVVGLNDASDSVSLVAFIEAKAESEPAPAELRDFLAQSIPSYMVPSRFVTLEKLPLTPNGKIDRVKLRSAEQTIGRIDSDYVEPRDDAERRLQAIWEETLDVRPIGVRHEFFDLGGTSLLATRMIAKVHKSFNQKLPVAAFFQNPTIEVMARALKHEAKPATSEHRLISLNPGSSAGTIFLLHAGIGLCRLARQLNEGFASFATLVPSPSNGARDSGVGAPQSVEQLAAPHVALIRAQMRSGRCILVGHSFGGVLAFEIAHQLQRDGIDVDTILLLDSWAKTPLWWQKLKMPLLQRAHRSMRFRARHSWSFIRNKTAEGLMWFAPASDASGSQGAAAEPTDFLFSEVPETILALYRNARKNYQYKPLDCRAVLFQCQDDPETIYAGDSQMGWAGLFLNGLEVIETPGNHTSLLQDPHVKTLARSINDRLELLDLRGSQETWRSHEQSLSSLSRAI